MISLAVGDPPIASLLKASSASYVLYSHFTRKLLIGRYVLKLVLLATFCLLDRVLQVKELDTSRRSRFYDKRFGSSNRPIWQESFGWFR